MDNLENIKKEIENTQVIIIAGGRAKRMGKIDKPKALLELNGKCLIDYTLEFLKNSGFKNFVFLLGYKHEEIEAHIGDGSKYGITVIYSVEPETMKGRGKALKYALTNNKIDRNKRAIVCYPDDLYLDRNLPIKLLLHHLHGTENRDILVTALFTSGTEYPYGVGEIDSEQFVTEFVEKPFIQKYTNTAFYVIEPEVYSEIEKKIDLDSEDNPEFEQAVLPDLAKDRKVTSMIIPSSVWLPINTSKEHSVAEKFLNSNSKKDSEF
ncbi:MAG: nucleotidyltransferase family protein [Candidatus Aenigmarchaeota archaeon]|nr:nucleotidyltransferase family protein [Candidatus Aenigmarchaeota archaeon]